MTKLRHCTPQDDHERQILLEIERAQKALEAAHAICLRRTMGKTANGTSLRTRYRDTTRSLATLLDSMRGIRGFAPLPEPFEAPKVKEPDGKQEH
jgi:hypothetical protein